jgi:hypothetical protein
MNRRDRRRAAALARRASTGYVDRILRGFQPSPGRYDCMAEHERGCRMLDGGTCTCTPAICVISPDGRRGRDGKEASEAVKRERIVSTGPSRSRARRGGKVFGRKAAADKSRPA